MDNTLSVTPMYLLSLFQEREFLECQIQSLGLFICLLMMCHIYDTRTSQPPPDILGSPVLV